MADCDYKIAQRLTPLRDYDYVARKVLLTADLISRLTAQDKKEHTTNNHQGRNAQNDVVSVCILKHFSEE